MPILGFRDILEPADAVRDVRFGRDSYDSVSDASAVVPCPMCRDEAVQGLMLTNALDQRMSRCFVIAALQEEGSQPRLEDQRGQDRRP